MSEHINQQRSAGEHEATKPRWPGWRDIFLIEGSGVRSTLAIVAPLILGQAAGRLAIGMMLAIGGLQVSFADMDGATMATLLWATFGSAAIGFLGAVVNRSPAGVAISVMAVVAFALSMLGAFGEVAANVGFVMAISYVLAQSRSVSLQQGEATFVTLALGGLWAVLLTMILWRLRRRLGDKAAGEAEDGHAYTNPLSAARAPSKRPGKTRVSWWDALRAHGTLRSPVFKHAVRAAVATAAAVAIGRCLHPPHAFWLVLTVVVILKPDFTATRRRTVERLLGTVAGGAFAMLPAAYVTNIAALDGLLVVFGILAFSHLPRNYGLYAFFLTPFIVLFSTIAAPHESGIALARMYETLFGGALAFAIAFLLRSPRHYWPPRKG